MTDVFSRAKRSAVMAKIRSSGNRDTELRMMRLLREAGITGWRRGSRRLGRPDFIFPSGRVVVFVDGCFWHGCPRHFRRPSSRQAYWDAKISRNQKRDREVTRHWRRLGWRVIRLWEHALARKCAPAAIRRIRQALAAA